MDTLDLFRQLTRGVKFTKRKQILDEQTNKKQHVIKDIDIKNEEIEDLPTEDIESEKEEADNVEFELVKNHEVAVQPVVKKKPKKQLTEEQKQAKITEEKVNNLRREQSITVLGKNIPPPIELFEDLHTKYKVSERLVKNLTTAYRQPTPVQMQAMPIMLEGRALMACAPTGSGKTIAFLVPIINDLRSPQKVGFRALILAPTRELAQQIFRECAKLCEKTALKVEFISKVKQATNKFGPDSSKKYDILISTPNRVRFLLQQEPPLLDFKSVEWLIIDEADRLMEKTEQNNFKEQLDDIMAACTNNKKKIALFSATYTVPVAKWALKNLKNLARLTIGQQNSAADTVKQELLFVGAENGKLLAIRNLVQEGLKPPVLVFVQSKDRAKQLFEELLYDGINVDVIHADRTQQQRDNCVRAFREGNIWVLICTELMSRGIDFKGVNLVINYDFPPSTISYIHRIGRSGRAGRPGRAITFFTYDDKPYLRNIAEIIRNSGGKIPEFMLKMKKPRKSVQKQLEKKALKREEISTKIRPESNKLERIENTLKKSTNSAVNNKKLKTINKIREKQKQTKAKNIKGKQLKKKINK